LLRGIDLGGSTSTSGVLSRARSGSGQVERCSGCVNLLEPIDQGDIVARAARRSRRRGVDVNRVRREIGIVFQASTSSRT
jgi:ABC-type polar amino acid transport system ATPase subunit